ncbi:hypothetical protein LTR78_004694 [Recurvomyces mirabilis]|uniref:SPT2 n=1 Tax=Recurvomyces mirabilis TaxID=574656 RepID=A0AAE1C2K3_9PEZI|nr:hypothetical protein LTR78_004694 [Recurvomyces mirabilis]KAK5152812.1 hypothetical protein LTS14_007919 [Recurvomyces mirabilis]
MTSFSSLLSTLGDKSQAAQSPASSRSTTTQTLTKADGAADRFKLTPNNAVAGVKRRSEDPDTQQPTAKTIKTEQGSTSGRPIASSGRFQLSTKNTTAKAANTATSASATSARPSVQQPLKNGVGSTPTPPGTADGPTKSKKGFASILERAKVAEAASKATSGGGIKHKPVEKLTRKERVKLMEEAKLQKTGRKGALADRSRSGTPNSIPGLNGAKKVLPQETSYKGTMKKAAAEPLSYKGTMRKADPSAPKPPPKKGLAQDKYGGYASWDDLDDAEDDEIEDEEEGGYDDSEDDMEGGFDELEAEEDAALKAARREDQVALQEEGRLKREKEERKRKLLALSKSMAGKKKF